MKYQIVTEQSRTKWIENYHPRRFGLYDPSSKLPKIVCVLITWPPGQTLKNR